MVAINYQPIMADVMQKTVSSALIRMGEGRRNGELVWVPMSCFEESEFVDLGDDEVVVVRWFLAKEGLI